MKFSIIIPIFNVENYLSTCLESIVAQSSIDYECILVDDGSTDASSEIAKSFCLQHPQFKLFHKKNGGLSDARNFGLSQASGEYIIFVDSDDYIHINYLKIIKQAVLAHSPDLIYVNYQRVSENCKDLNYKYVSTQKTFLISENILLQKPNFSWARVVKRNFYWKDPFPIGLLYEDIYVSTILASKVKKIYSVDEALYAYRKRDGSITNDLLINHPLSMLEIISLLWNLVDQNILDKKYYIGVLVNLIPSFALVLIRNKKFTQMKYEAELVSVFYRRIGFFEYLRQSNSFKNRISSYILAKKYLNILALQTIKYFLIFKK